MINNWKKFNEELNKSTYLSAASKASEKGLEGLAKRFKEHGKEFGINPDERKVSFATKSGEKKELDISYIEYIDNEINIFGETQTGDVVRYEGSIDKLGIQLFLNGNKESLPSTRQDARKLLTLLSAEGVDCSKVDVRTFTAEDVW